MISLIAALSAPVIAFSSPLVGVWTSVQTFGHNIQGGQVHLAIRGKLIATIGGESVTAPISPSGLATFDFPDGSRMIVNSRESSIAGQWIQPSTVTYGGAYASPIVLTRRGSDGWVGTVRPIADVTHFTFTVTENADGALNAFFRNPETNTGSRLGVRTLTADGSTVRLHAEGKPDFTGAYDASAQTLSFAFEGYPAPFVFHKVTGAPAALSYVYHVPARTDDGWRTASLTDVGLDPAKITAFVNSFDVPATSTSSPFIDSVAIVRHGKLVLDGYFNGYDASTPHDVRSAGKSITTLMVGDAMHDDRKLTPGSRLYDILPQYRDALSMDPRKKNITVADLMTMSSGLACDDNDDNSPGNEDTMESQTAVPDWYRYTLALPAVADPGSKAVYCSGGINALGAVISAAEYGSLADFFYKRFASPMQFGAYALPMMPPPVRQAYMAGGGQFLPRDFLKFGQLILNSGTWSGRRIVDARFIADATAPHSGLNSPGDYGYGWHLSTFVVGGVSYPAINAGGNGGQLLFVIPKLDMAVMITASNYGQYPVWRKFQTEPFEDYLIPAAIGS